jgi:hypothetical protein
VDALNKAAATANATVIGQVALQPKFNDISGANQSSLDSINSSIATSDGVVLTTGSDPQTVYQEQAAQLVATAILDKGADSAALTPAAAQTLLSAYAQDGYLTITGTPTDRATLAILVTPQSAPTDGPNDPANQVLLAITQQFASASSATVVAGSTSGSASGSAISVLRSSSVSALVSSVDNADTTLGQISVIEALATQLAGGKPNSYGISGASAAGPTLPSPSASASAPASATATPHSTATGKAGKKKT